MNAKTPNTLYRLVDTFNGLVISGHHSLMGAEKAARRHDRAVKRANGQSSYIPTRIDRWESSEGWQPVPHDEVIEVKMELDRM